MSGVDLVIIVLVALGLVQGFRQGFVVEVAGILGAVIGLAVARDEYVVVRGLLLRVASASPWVTALSYLIVFLLVWAVIILLARRIRFFVRLLMLGFIDRLGGAIIGLLQAALLIELLLYLGKRLHNPALQRAIVHARLAPLFLDAIPFLHRLFPHMTA